ncbi:MAG: Mov34/MPN/PAD-1 family protein [Candidatus Nitrosocaldus sp.]|nr:Mov34/MPN/PAD-1 family protein [Candidatus Nitrosocaldus sp.]MDW8275002.1 Mov34/MPN/PAD-1 family protein [Candidatus Nitrosocaldus sp.]
MNRRSRRVIIKRSALDSIISYCKMRHPNEAILILCGKSNKDTITVERLMIPPFSYFGPYYSGFPTMLLPFDRSILGTMHSHPNGSSEPSLTDLNSDFIGYISIIVSYPYEDGDVHVYNSRGERLEYSVAE